MDQIQREKIAAKLKKIKALAERGVGGEKETAMRMYEDLKARYELEDEEIMLDAVTLHWFGYATELEEELLTQIFYKVTGGTTYHIYTGKYSRRKKRGCDCTEIEAAEITLLFNFYKAELKRELEAFMVAFRSGNNLYPDKTARCYKENNGPAPERTDEEKRMLKKAAWYSQVLDKRTVVINTTAPVTTTEKVAIASDNVPEGATETNADGTVNLYDAAGNITGSVTKEEAEKMAAEVTKIVDEEGNTLADLK